MITGLWAHTYHHHKDVSEDFKLQEIQVSGARWIVYWKQYSDGGRQNNPTMAKLEQAQQQNFHWSIVVSWNLR